MQGAREASKRGSPVAGLTPDDLKLLETIGFRAVGRVTGTSVYHARWILPTGVRRASMPLSAADAVNEARALALSRLEDQAARCGGEVVVGVTLRRVWYDWAEDLVEFTVVGTALVGPEGPGNRRPILSLLSASDFYALFRSAYSPAGIASGTGVYYVAASKESKQLVRRPLDGWWNAPVIDLSAASAHAREIALSHVHDMVERLRADGVVGLKLEILPRLFGPETSRSMRGDLQVTVHAAGTAIVRSHAPNQETVYSTLNMEC